MDRSILLDSDISDTQAAIKTYANYSEAWCLWPHGHLSAREAQSQLEGFSRLRPSQHCDPKTMRQHLLRGYLTLKLIQEIPVDEKPDFGMISALWLPVQTYYAVHGFGMAFLASKRGASSLPNTHGAFMRSASEHIVRPLFPSPFSAVLSGGYKGNQYLEPELINIRDDRMYIGSGMNLARPTAETRDAHIAQCLDTTRRRLTREKLERERAKARKPGKKRGVLKKQQAIGIAQNVPPTTVFDYLYRTRIKSNYEDPTMYHESSDDAYELLQLVRSTQKLASTLCAFLAAALWRTIDKSTKEELGAAIDIDRLMQHIEQEEQYIPW